MCKSVGVFTCASVQEMQTSEYSVCDERSEYTEESLLEKQRIMNHHRDKFALLV